MVDILPFFSSVIEPLGAQTETSYNDLSATIPLIVLTQLDNSTQVAYDDGDLYSSVEIQADVYEFSEQAAFRLAIKVNDLATAAGFRRTFSESIKEDNLCRHTLKFSATVDEKAMRLYRGGVN